MIGLIDRIEKAKVGSAEAEFGQRVKHVANDLANFEPASGSIELKPAAVDMATLNPQAALLNAWSEIRFGLTELACKNNLLNEKTSRSDFTLVWSLVDVGLIPKSYAMGILLLFQLYNQTAHQIDFKPSQKSVLEYLKVAEKLKQLLLESDKPASPVVSTVEAVTIAG